MSAWVRIAAGVLVLVGPATAPAHWLRRPAPVAAFYYYPPPAAVVPVYRPVYYVAPAAVAACVPAPLPPVPAPRPYAVPSAAPPSGQPLLPRVEEISSREPPRVNESRYPSEPTAREARYFSGERAEDRPAARPAGGFCWVGFWNERDKTVTLTVDGQTHSLPPGKHAILRVKRQFAWQVAGDKVQLVRIPEDRVTGVIVIGQ